MEDGGKLSEGVRIREQAGAKHIGFDERRELERAEIFLLLRRVVGERHGIAPARGRVQKVGDDDVGMAAAVERPDERAADEAGAASDENATVQKTHWEDLIA